MYLKHSDFCIREFREADAESLFINYKSCLDCTYFLTSKTHTSLEQTEVAIIKWQKLYAESAPPFLVFAIAEAKSNEVFGLLVLVFGSDHAEVHFGFSKRYWKQNLGDEVLKSAIRYLQSKNVKSIQTQPHINHQASIRLLEKNGFIRHGILKNYAVFPQMSNDRQDCWDMRIDL